MTAPVIVTVPFVPPVKVRACALVTVLERVIFAPVAALIVVSTATVVPSVTAPVIEIAPPLVFTKPPKLIAPV